MQIQIIDNKEKLVDITKFIPGLKINIEKRRLKKEGGVFLRESVAKMLKNAHDSLTEDYNFVINDAWRPSEIQKGYFEHRLKYFKEKYPELTDKKAFALTSKYVAPYKGKKASGHLTGAAVDLRLLKNGRKLPMISKKLDYKTNASSKGKKLPNYIQKNRKLFFEIMQKAGFTNYPKEYWHWCYGDYLWAKLNKKDKAIYGITNKPLN